MSIKKKNTKIKPIEYEEGKTTDWTQLTGSCGSHTYFPLNQTLIWVMNARPDCEVTVVIENSVKVAMRLDVPLDEYYKNIGNTRFIDKIAA